MFHNRLQVKRNDSTTVDDIFEGNKKKFHHSNQYPKNKNNISILKKHNDRQYFENNSFDEISDSSLYTEESLNKRISKKGQLRKNDNLFNSIFSYLFYTKTNAVDIEQRKKNNFRYKIKSFVIELLKEVSAHGFVYLAKSGLHFIERVIWTTFICVSIYGVISLAQRTWERFQTSPCVVSMDRNKLVWNTSFPSLTVCPHKRIDEIKVEEYINTHKKHFQTEKDKEMFLDFVIKLANASFDNIETLVINKSFGIKPNKYLELVHELQWSFSPEMSSGTPIKMYIYETVTELGVCHSVNSLIARYNSYEYWKNNEWGPLEHGDKVTVHPLDGEIYAQIINLSTSYDVYFHGSMEVPDIAKQKYTFPESDYTTVELIALEMFTAKDARDFTVNQRRCRFSYEAEEMLISPIYSFGLCRNECRMKLSLRICKCIPHFYRSTVRGGRILPVCDFEGFACLARIKKEVISLQSDTIKIDCKCFANCDESNFFVQSFRSRVWFLGANLQWGITNYPKMQLKREVLFSFADVLVYIGGLAGFFLGCSLLSLAEFLYYFTARFARRMIC